MIITEKKEVRKIFRKLQSIINKDCHNSEKLIRVGSATWTNGLTKRPQKTDDIYVLGWASSTRPLLVTSVVIGENRYQITNKFNHINVASWEDARCVYRLNGDGKLLPEEFDVQVYGQEFCNPITALHVIETDEKDIANLLKVTLSSQNYDDAYSEHRSLLNSDTDYPIRGASGCLLLYNSSPLEMLLGKSAGELNRMEENSLNAELRKLTSIQKDEVWAKAKLDSEYTLIEKTDYRNSKNFYSQYYPVYDYNDIQDMEISIPRDNFDLGVYGLGSAGTAILDQVLRSNWVKNIYLCDFDFVENKNMINQWYTEEHLGLRKTTACINVISTLRRGSSDNIIPTDFRVASDDSKFQETKLEEKKFKYVISGFDSIEARLDFFNAILDGKIEAKYLIDCRYLDLACSIYFIDLENTDEVEFYKANLEADAELIKTRNEKEKLSRGEFMEWYERKGYFRTSCYSYRSEILGEIPASFICTPRGGGDCNCRSEQCVNYLYDLYLKSVPNPNISRSDASCVKYNYIDIYKYVGAIIFGAFRKIENELTKPFTLIEAETDVKGLPNYMVVRG